MANINEVKKYHFIYKTTNLLNNKYYVGMHSTSNLKDGYLGSGKRLRYSIRKYGESNFKLEILEFFSTREELIKRERELVNEDLIKDFNCLNLKPGGSGGWCNLDHQKRATKGANKRRLELLVINLEFKQKYSQKCRERNIKQYEEGTRKRDFQYDWTGKKHKPESIQKMKKVKEGHGKGETNSQFGTMWITDGSKNKKIKKEDSIPEGWYSRKYKKVDLFWVTNEIENKRLKSSLPIPEGWRRGRKR